MYARAHQHYDEDAIAGLRRGMLVGNLDEKSDFYGEEPVQPGRLLGGLSREYDPDNGLPLDIGAEPVRIRDRVNFLRGRGHSITQIAAELDWTVREVQTTQAMTRSNWEKRVRLGERHARRTVKIPVRLGAYESLRDRLNKLIATGGRSAFYQAVLAILDARGLVYTWRYCGNKRVRIWWTNGDPAFMEIVRQFERQLPSEQNSFHRHDLSTLQQLVSGNREFYFDFTSSQYPCFMPTDLPHEEVYQ